MIEKSSDQPYIKEHVYNSRNEEVQCRLTIATDPKFLVTDQFTYEHDDKGRITSVQERAINQDGNVNFSEKRTFSFDNAGNIIEVKKESDETTIFRYYYGKNGLLLTELTILPKDIQIATRDEYTYSFWK
jgi:type II secretory pathway component HofQ